MREATDTRPGPSDGNAVELGPVDYLVIEFPADRRTGEGLHHVVDLVDRGLIRILDLIFTPPEHRRDDHRDRAD